MPATRYAVFGDPVDHSLSPRIHSLFAEQTGEALEYTRQQVRAEDFDSAVRAFFAGGGGGLNITSPHKEHAAALADSGSHAVSLAGAANTLYLQDEKICAENTDGAGLVSDLLLNLGWQLEAQRILLLGAGGAVRGVLEPLLACKPAQIVLANRTAEKAQQLVDAFSPGAELHQVSIEALPLHEAGGGYDLVINGSSAGLSGSVPAIDATAVDGARCYDMVYGSGAAPFLQWAGKAGARSVADGLGMLVEQAAAAFYIWRKIHPDAGAVIEQLRNEL
ncbi:MAG: shikimate dehydrogenase [Gammaproteobacteria bacterium]|nr:shikimate dehydrogenase [Gammaproteobacteria bacterium]MBT8152218.1 shikimate dehydrogenase [Gammaproteobacteria bacterium]NND38842.1 shikimate dehydrogenase [Pseudomonadales bacterium]RZV54469.1 MAG: shikimate dehydrogenase [Pseudomonadales bacterium]